ncbi:MAG: hypothetical protein AAB408_00805 [Patescibacteria group bacterium]
MRPESEAGALHLSEQMSGLSTPEMSQVELEGVAEAREIVDEEIERLSEEIDALIDQRERRYQEMRQSGSADTAGLEDEVSPVRKKLSALRGAFKKMVLYVIPLAFVVKTARDEMHADAASFSNRVVAEKQLKEKGTTDERRLAYIPGVSDLLYRGITPVAYQEYWDVIADLPENLISGREHAEKSGDDLSLHKKDMPERDDAWRFYLGLPQENDTFSVSRFRPPNATGDKYYYSINGWFEKFSNYFETEGYGFSLIGNARDIFEKSKKWGDNQRSSLRELIDKKESLVQELELLFKEEDRQEKELEDAFKKLHKINLRYGDWSTEQRELLSEYIRDDGKMNAIKKQIEGFDRMLDENTIKEQDLRGEMGLSSADLPWWMRYIKVTAQGEVCFISVDLREETYGVMGNFSIHLGEDERGQFIAYHDVWDLDQTVEGEEGLLGKAFEIYDRIYYDPETLQVIQQD